MDTLAQALAAYDNPFSSRGADWLTDEVIAAARAVVEADRQRQDLGDGTGMAAFEQCDSRLRTQVFSHYAYGDPMPHNALYIGEEAGGVPRVQAITVYVRCERELGHAGRHLARQTEGWS